jgi:phytoene dehydrogenase-like protein
MTVKGRSQAYVNKLVSVLESSGVEIRTSAPVSAVERTASGEADRTRPLYSSLWILVQDLILPFQDGFPDF